MNATSGSTTPADSGFAVSRCDVEPNRYVHCEMIRIAKGTTAGSATFTPVVASCNYFVLAAVAQPSATGATP